MVVCHPIQFLISYRFEEHQGTTWIAHIPSDLDNVEQKLQDTKYLR